MFPKNQHYVPQFLLKNFCLNKDSQIYVFDKSKEVVFETHVRNVAAENGFYNFKADGATFSIEHDLSNLERASSQIIEKIIKQESLSGMTSDEKATLSIFLAAQFSRTKQQRLMLKQMNDLLVAFIRRIGGDPNNVKNFTPFSDEEEINRFAIMTLEENVKKFWPVFHRRGWILFKSTQSMRYYISDNPITLHNDNDLGFMGNLGLGVKGIEIYFPLSPNLSLVIIDESNEQMIRKGYKNRKELPLDKRERRVIKGLMRGLETGTSVQSENENIEFHNSMQVAYSSRFVFSTDKGFDLAYKMIKMDPKYKGPPLVINANQ